MQPHPFDVPLQFGSEYQIQTYRRMEAEKELAEQIQEYSTDVLEGALRRLNLIEERNVLLT
jgi:hypothetical protein